MSEVIHASTESGFSPADAIARLKTPITVEQWAGLEEFRYCDLIEGCVKEKPNVAFWHEFLLLDLLGWLDNYVRGHDLGRLVCSNAPLRISAYHGRRPDIFFIPKELFHRVGKNLFNGVPPLVIEILSPNSITEDRVHKRREYAQLGIGEYWIVDFPNRTVEVYSLRQLGDGTRDYELVATARGNDVFRPAFFPGLDIPLADIWPTEFENRTDD
ncbi:MAG: Uma2 family endonuclease [Planctomycetes bacterium]|nr:Uma2 family endonuclease [Planctomycetota bacterium]